MERLTPLREFLTYISREDDTTPHRALGMHWDSQEVEDRSKAKSQAMTFTGVSKGKARQDGVNSLRLAGLSDDSGLWAAGVISSCLVPGSG